MRLSSSTLRLLAVLPAYILLAAALAGCSSGPPTLAKVGSHVITTQDFLDVARLNQGQYSGSPDSAKSALLADLVKRELLVIEAERRGLVGAAEQDRMRKRLEDQLGVRALVQALAPADVPVSDAEVRALYEQRAKEAHLWVVFTTDRPTIDLALAALRHGEDFGAVADRYNPSGMTPPQGDMGFRTAGTLLPVLDRAVAEDSVGRVYGPIESPGDGWFLVRISERRPRQQEPFDVVRDRLKQSLQSNKQRALLSRAQRDLQAQYHVEIADGAAQALFARYNAPKDTVMVGQVRMPVPGEPTPAEAARVLLRYDGADGKRTTYTLGDAVTDLRDPNNPHPDFQMVPMVDQWLHSMALQRVALIEARRRHLAEQPETARRIHGQLTNELLQAAYGALVVNSVSVTEQDLRADYERRRAQLARLQSAHVRLATFADSSAAVRAGQAVARGTALADAVRASGGAGHLAETDVRFPTPDPLWSRLQGSLSSMRPGDVGGPFPLGRGWALLQLVSKVEEAPAFEALDPSTREALRSDAMQFRQEQRLVQLTDSLRSRYPVTIRRDRLARIPWPVPPEKPGT